VGTDINQKDDGHIVGTKYCVSHGTKADIKSSPNGERFTVIGLTAASGEAVMCIIIFAGKELSYDQPMGHDIRADYNTEGSVRDNTGPGKAFPGAPTCQFWDKDLPALIACSPNGPITSDILKQASKRLDGLGMYEREPGGRISFILLDAHDSRLQVPFFGYVNDDVHKWKVCIGLPNGTGKWQVGDLSQQNGQYKVEMTCEKGKLVLFKTIIGSDTVIEKSDAIPLVNQVWPKFFGRMETNKTAIRDRGWYPANRMFLHDPEILKIKSALSNGTRIATKEEAGPTITTSHATMDDISDISNVSSQLLSTGSTAETPSSTISLLLPRPCWTCPVPPPAPPEKRWTR
jgi:hypothetical protein